jgi:hypothetical protein
MNAIHLIASLERFAHILPALVRDVSAGDAKWKPADGAWSILEIVTHLCDEEVDDFRTRVRLMLESPEKDWPEIHPSRWAIERKYNEGDLRKAVDRFVREREASIAWLRSLKPPDVDWSIAHAHPTLGAIRAGDLLTSWAAHDALHLRQIAKRMYQMAQRDGGPEFSAAYAGEWGA